MKLEKRGRFITLREEDGRLMQRVLDPGTKRETWRSVLRKMTDNGFEQFVVLREISLGSPFQVELEDGTMSQPMIPSLETQRAAAKDIIEFLHGKAVAQTEVTAAEQDAMSMEQVRALSDEELTARVVEALSVKKGAPSAITADSTGDAGRAELRPKLVVHELLEKFKRPKG